MGKLARFACILLPGLVGCAHGPTADGCLDPTMAARALGNIEAMVDRLTGEKPQGSLLVEDECLKKKYTRSGYRIVVYRRPGDPPDRTQASMTQIRERTTTPEACLADAENELRALGLAAATDLVGRVKAKEAWRWFDPDIGVAKWLRCSGKHDEEYFGTLATFVHELNHDAKEDSCVYVAEERKLRCFELAADLPPVKFARLKLQTNVPVIQEVFDRLLNLYYGPESENTALSLFDELNAYTVGSDVRIAALEHGGKRTLFDRGGDREVSFLPVFLAQSAAYVTKLRNLHPEAYRRHFAPGTKTRENLWALFARGEKSYETWDRLTKASTKELTAQTERRTYRFYRELKDALDRP